MRIGIIAGSIRQGRKAANVAEWVKSLAASRTDAEFEILDLKDFDVPLLDAPTLPGAAGRQYDSENVRRWSAAVDSCDAFIFVTPEYNHSVPGAFKNAVDSLGPEWTKKPVAFVSYGASNGIRAVEHWRQIVANFQMNDVRAQVELSVFGEFDQDGKVAPLERREDEVHVMLDQLIEATGH